MNLAEIRNAGGFVSAEPVKVPVQWKEHKFDVWVKRLSFGDVEKLYGLEDRARSSQMISTAVLLGEDKEAMTYEAAYQLDVGLATKLIEAFSSINVVDQKKVA